MKEYRCPQMPNRTSSRNSAFRLMVAGGTAIILASGASAQTAGPPLLIQQTDATGKPATNLTQPGFLPGGQLPALPVQVNVPPPVPTVSQQAAEAALNANAPTEKTELQGTPFPSMVPGSPRQPPLSNKSMGVETGQTGRNMEQLTGQTTQRLGEIRTGVGATLPTPVVVPTLQPPSVNGLQSPNVSGYASELQELAALQRSTRLLQARRQEAEAAMAVWGVLYDPRREDEAMRKEKEVREIKEKEIKDKEVKDKEEKEASERARVFSQPSVNGMPSAPSLPGAIEAAVRMELPLPRIVSVFGTQGKLRATLLVPYVGEVTASPGTALPGDRRVMSVSSDGVTVRDPRMGILSLGYGDSVPAMPPQQQGQNLRQSPAPLFSPPSFPAVSTPPPIPSTPSAAR